MAKYFLNNSSAESCADGTIGWDMTTTQGTNTSQSWTVNNVSFAETDAYHVTVGAAGKSGDYEVSVQIVAIDANTSVRWRLQRKNSSCTVQDSSSYSAIHTTPGIKSQTITFSPTWAAGDVLVLSAEIRRDADHGNKTATVNVNDADTFVDEPAGAIEIFPSPVVANFSVPTALFTIDLNTAGTVAANFSTPTALFSIELTLAPVSASFSVPAVTTQILGIIATPVVANFSITTALFTIDHLATPVSATFSVPEAAVAALEVNPAPVTANFSVITPDLEIIHLATPITANFSVPTALFTIDHQAGTVAAIFSVPIPLFSIELSPASISSNFSVPVANGFIFGTSPAPVTATFTVPAVTAEIPGIVVKTIGTGVGSAGTGNVDTVGTTAVTSGSVATAFTTELTAPGTIEIAGTLYNIASITDDDNLVTVETVPSGSNQAYNIGLRHYSTMVLWEAGIDNTTYPDTGTTAKGECYNDSDFDESLTINASASNVTAIVLSVADGEQHDGTAGTGAKLVATQGRRFNFASTSVPTKFEWLEVDWSSNGTSGGIALEVDGSSSPILMSKLVLHGISMTATMTITDNNGNDEGGLLDSFIYDCESTNVGNSFGYKSDGTGAAVRYCLNDTFHDLRSSGTITNVSVGDSASNHVRNVICTDPGGSGTKICYSPASPSSATIDHNAASDTTASGTGSLDSIVTDDQFVSTVGGSEDLHLKSGADAIDAGVDLGTSPAGVNIDINGRNRDAEGDTWDMGAHQFVLAGAINVNATPVTANFVITVETLAIILNAAPVSAAFSVVGASTELAHRATPVAALFSVPTATFDLTGTSPAAIAANFSTPSVNLTLDHLATSVTANFSVPAPTVEVVGGASPDPIVANFSVPTALLSIELTTVPVIADFSIPTATFDLTGTSPASLAADFSVPSVNLTLDHLATPVTATFSVVAPTAIGDPTINVDATPVTANFSIPSVNLEINHLATPVTATFSVPIQLLSIELTTAPVTADFSVPTATFTLSGTSPASVVTNFSVPAPIAQTVGGVSPTPVVANFSVPLSLQSIELTVTPVVATFSIITPDLEINHLATPVTSTFSTPAALLTLDHLATPVVVTFSVPTVLAGTLGITVSPVVATFSIPIIGLEISLLPTPAFATFGLVAPVLSLEFSPAAVAAAFSITDPNLEKDHQAAAISANFSIPAPITRVGSGQLRSNLRRDGRLTSASLLRGGIL